jgi:iron complex transport system ATP-binding protein
MLSIENLTTGYFKGKNTLSVSEALSFKLPAGSILGILGRNGSGKSTLLKTIAGSLKPIEGNVLIDTTNLHRLKNNSKSLLLSIVTTERNFSGLLTGWDILTMGRYPHNGWLGSLTPEDKKILDKVVQQIQMETKIHQPIATLSDGQLQRLLMGRALVQETPYLLLDEPTVHLDLHHKAQVFGLIKQAAEQSKKTVLFSTHEINHAMQFCTQLLLLHEGKGYFGTPKELVEQGVFNQLFPNTLVAFDPKSKQFKLCY